MVTGPHYVNRKKHTFARPEGRAEARTADTGKLPKLWRHDKHLAMPERHSPPRRSHPSSRHRPRPQGGKRSSAPPWAKPREEDGPAILYGWHTVKAALENPNRRILRLYATENAARRLVDDGITLTIPPELVRPDVIAGRLPPDAVHQGLLAEAEPLSSLGIEDLPAQGIVLALDQITDPHNVGAILRSAAAFAVEGIVITARHSPEATGVLAKAASGALEYVPIVEVGNLARALEALRGRGFMLVGLDSGGSTELSAAPLSAPLALVVGAEGRGLRQLTRSLCDQVARLDLPGAIKSLNVSNAAALALYIANKRIASQSSVIGNQ